MNDKTQPSHEPAQFETQQNAALDGGSAMAFYDAQSLAVRANMEKLKALRLAKEAAEAAANPVPVKKKRAAATTKKAAAPAAPAPKLSDWLAGQEKGGFRR